MYCTAEPSSSTATCLHWRHPCCARRGSIAVPSRVRRALAPVQLLQLGVELLLEGRVRRLVDVVHLPFICIQIEQLELAASVILSGLGRREQRKSRKRHYFTSPDQPR